EPETETSSESESLVKDPTVKDAVEAYLRTLRANGKSVLHTERRARSRILPVLGHRKVRSLTSRMLREWHESLATGPVLIRKKYGEKTYRTKQPGTDPESMRRRRSTANRILVVLRAALNHAVKRDESLAPIATRWGRSLERFQNTEVSRARFLTAAEA